MASMRVSASMPRSPWSRSTLPSVGRWARMKGPSTCSWMRWVYAQNAR